MGFKKPTSPTYNLLLCPAPSEHLLTRHLNRSTVTSDFGCKGNTAKLPGNDLEALLSEVRNTIYLEEFEF